MNVHTNTLLHSLSFMEHKFLKIASINKVYELSIEFVHIKLRCCY